MSYEFLRLELFNVECFIEAQNIVPLAPAPDARPQSRLPLVIQAESISYLREREH